MPAFGTAVTRDIKVGVASEVRADVTLKPGEVATSVEVSGASLSQGETTSDTLGATLTSSTVKDLPVSGRAYTKLMFLTPRLTGSPHQITVSPGSSSVFSLSRSSVAATR